MRGGQNLSTKRAVGVLLVLCLSLFGGGCEAAQQIAQGLAENAPPAKPPKVIAAFKVTQWPGDTTYYSTGYSFTVQVQHGWINELRLLENGQPVAPFDGNNPDNDKKTVFLREAKQHDEKALTTVTEYRILPRTDRPPTHGEMVTYEFEETSINPKYKGTADERASMQMKVVTITRPAVIALFNVPSTVVSGSAADITWRVNDCKQIQLLEADSVIEEATGTPAASTLQGTKSVTIKQNTDFVLRAKNAVGAVVQAQGKLLVTAPPPCPGGQPQYFQFCVSCPGGSLGAYSTEWTQLACSEADAKTSSVPTRTARS